MLLQPLARQLGGRQRAGRGLLRECDGREKCVQAGPQDGSFKAKPRGRPFLVHGDLPDVGLVLDSATPKIAVAGVQVQDSSGSDGFLTSAAAMTTRLWKILDA